MEILEIMKARHSVRSYIDKPIEEDKVNALKEEIEKINAESGLNIQLFTEEPEAFSKGEKGYGQFKGCRNYFTLAGPKNNDEKIGYYGERLVLFSQSLGLNTCWVALTYNKSKVNINTEKDEKLYVVIALGYGENQGVPHKSKPIASIAEITDETPEWFKDGIEAVMLAPTAINQQKFYFKIRDGKVEAKEKLAFYSKMDLGIAKYHFELGAGKENFEWA